MDLEWWWHISVGSLIVTNVPLWWGCSYGRSWACVGTGFMGYLSTFCPIFLLILKVLKKISFLKEGNTLILLQNIKPLIIIENKRLNYKTSFILSFCPSSWLSSLFPSIPLFPNPFLEVTTGNRKWCCGTCTYGVLCRGREEWEWLLRANTDQIQDICGRKSRCRAV